MRLIQAYNELVVLQISQREFAAAEQGLQHALKLVTQFVAEVPDHVDGQLSHAVTLINVGWCISQSPNRDVHSRLEESLRIYQQSVEIYRRMAVERPGKYDIQRGLSMSLSNMGRRNMELRRFGEARRLVEECVQIRQALWLQALNSPDMQSLLAGAWNGLGDVILRSPTLPDSAFAEAIVAYEQSLELQQQLARENPAVPVYRDDVAGTLRNLSELYWRHADLERALEYRRRANAIYESELDQDEANLRLLASWAGSMVVQGDYEHRLGLYDEALASQNRARETWQRIAEQPDLLQEYRESMTRNLAGMIGALGFLERPAEAYGVALQQRQIVQDNSAALLSLAYDLDRAVRATTRGTELNVEDQAAVQRCLDLAIELFQQGASSEPDQAKKFVRTHPQLGDYESLLTLGERLQKDENDVRVLIDRSTTLRRLGHMPRAALDTNRATNLLDARLQQSARDAYALRWRATLHFRASHWAETVADCTPLLESRPNDAPILSGRGTAAARLGNWRQSWEDYDRLVAIDPSKGAYFNIAAVPRTNWTGPR